VVECRFVWLTRFRRLSRDFERMPEVLARLHSVVFVIRMPPKAAMLLALEANSQQAFSLKTSAPRCRPQPHIQHLQ
jgi:hypothetical protein